MGVFLPKDVWKSGPIWWGIEFGGYRRWGVLGCEVFNFGGRKGLAL